MKISAIFEELDDEILALSTGRNIDDEIIISVNPKEWYKSNSLKKWYVLYHELGHDVLNLNHGEGGEMMFNYTQELVQLTIPI